MNRIRIEVGSAKFVIATSEEEAYVQSLGQELDEQVQAILDASDRVTLNDALVLCALNYLDSYKKSEESADHMRSQLTDYLSDAARARLDLDEAKREIDRLNRRLEMMGQ